MIQQRKRPVQRAVGAPRLAGMPVSTEKSVHKLGPNEYTDVKISSSDLDPGLVVYKPIDDFTNPVFQEHGFDSGLGGTDPKQFTGSHTDGGHDPNGATERESPLAQAAQAMGKGFVVMTAHDLIAAPRVSTPHWIRDRSLFKQFMDGLDEETRKLDIVILAEFYINRRTDPEIFALYEEEHRLKFEYGNPPRKTRWTSTVNALKNRRTRLIDKGDALFGPSPDFIIPTPGRITHVASTEIERLEMIAAGFIVQDEYVTAVYDEKGVVKRSRFRRQDMDWVHEVLGATIDETPVEVMIESAKRRLAELRIAESQVTDPSVLTTDNVDVGRVEAGVEVGVS
jgi:hypothetical protein